MFRGLLTEEAQTMKFVGWWWLGWGERAERNRGERNLEEEAACDLAT